MSVATHLGLSDPDRDLLAEARTQWPTWSRQTPALGVVADLMELPGWTTRADRPDVDETLHALATLASPTGATTLLPPARWPGCCCPAPARWRTGSGP